MPDVSVIVTVYNKELYLRQCLDSLLHQTKTNLEIILVDDGSTDSSLQIMQEYASHSDTIHVIRQENQGLAGARISGYRRAGGKYVAWVDADDFAKPEMYERLYSLAEAEGADLVYCDYEYYPRKVASKAKWFREYRGKLDWRFIDKNTAFWNKLFRKDLLDRVSINDLLTEYGEYAPVVPMLEAEKISFTGEQLYMYRVGHDSMSGGSFDGKVQHYLRGVNRTRKLKQILKGKPYEAELSEYFDYRYIYTLILLAIVGAKNNDRASYCYAQSELRNMNYLKNRYTERIVREHYGAVKSLVMTRVIPSSYILAGWITKAVL